MHCSRLCAQVDSRSGREGRCSVSDGKTKGSGRRVRVALIGQCTWHRRKRPPSFRPMIGKNQSIAAAHDQSLSTHAMFSTARRRCLQGAGASLKSSASSQSPIQTAVHPPTYACRAFSTSNPCQSKIGRAPLSIPPEVQFEIIPPTKTRGGRISSRDEQGATVHVKGPLGEMSYTVPSFVEIVRDTPNGPPTVKVLNADERRQREMWGMLDIRLRRYTLAD